MSDTQLRQALLAQLTALIGGGSAHATLEEAAAGLPFELQGSVPRGLPYSPWQLLEHMRRAQQDIVSFSDNANGTYPPMQWPNDYWPQDPQPPNAAAWQSCLDAIRRDRETLFALLTERDLAEPFPWGDGQNLLRQALLIADHESYHTGELIVMRRLLGAWKPKEGHA